MPEFNQVLFNSQVFGGGITPPGPIVQVGPGLLYPALRKAGITLGPQRTPSVAQYQDAIDELNRLVGSLSCDRLFIYSITTYTFSLTGKQTYTIGASPDPFNPADFDAPRPQGIESANVISGGIRYAVRIVSDLQWAKISGQNIPNAIPWVLYNDRAYPLSTLYLYGQPASGCLLELFVWQLVPGFVTPADVVSLPPGYEDALVLNLALRLAPHFQRVIDPVLRMDARESLMRLESINAPQPIATLDTWGSCGGYDVMNLGGGGSNGSGGATGPQGPPGPPGPPGVAGPAVSAYMTGTSPVFLAGVSTAVPFNATEFDTTGTSSMHSNSTNNTRLVAPGAGYYMAVASHQFNAGSTGTVAKFVVNGTADVIGSQTQAVITAFVTAAVMAMVYLNAGDYLEYWITAVSADAAVFTYSDAPRAAARLQLIRVL